MIKMFAMMKKVIIAVAMLLYSLFSTAQSLRGNMDPSVKPGDDFWQYAEGEAGISVVSATRASLDDICARQNSNKFCFTLA